MNEIPAAFWMIVIAFLSLMFGLILFYFAMILRETSKTVAEGRAMLVNVTKITEGVAQIVGDVKGVVAKVQTFVVNPISFVKRFTGGNDED